MIKGQVLFDTLDDATGRLSLNSLSDTELLILGVALWQREKARGNTTKTHESHETYADLKFFSPARGIVSAESRLLCSITTGLVRRWLPP